MRNVSWRQSAIAVGFVGASGQALLLYHDLADCYPYKAMSNPSGSFYALLGLLGLIVAPPAALLICRVVSVRSIAYVPAVATLVSPGIFLLLFYLGHLLTGVDLDNTANFDGNTPMVPLGEFTHYAAELALAGVVVGLGCGVAISSLSRSIGSKGADSP